MEKAKYSTEVFKKESFLERNKIDSCKIMQKLE